MTPSNKIAVRIDGERLEATTRRMSGEQLRALVHPRPVNLWLDIDDAQDRLIAPEQVVEVFDGVRFFSDRPRTIYINKLPFVVNSAVISEAELRALPSPPLPVEHRIWKDVDDDLDDPIDRDEFIRIVDGDRFFSKPRPARATHIIVNLRKHAVSGRTVTYEQIVDLAFPEGPPAPGANITYTVTYTKAAGDKPQGTLAPFGVVTIKEGTVFNVRLTDKS